MSPRSSSLKSSSPVSSTKKPKKMTTKSAIKKTEVAQKSAKKIHPSEKKVLSKPVHRPDTQKKSFTEKKVITKNAPRTTALKKEDNTRSHKGVTHTPSRGARFLRTLGLQFLIAGSAAVILILMGIIEHDVFTTKPGKAQDVVHPATIGLEFDGRVALGVLMAQKESDGYAIISNKSSKDIYISLPSSWSRLEVTGASLEATKGELPVFGFTRYLLPKYAALKLHVDMVPSDIFFDAPGKGVAAVEVKTVNLDALKMMTQTVLVQRQTLVRLSD